jgi:hypothetical protein
MVVEETDLSTGGRHSGVAFGATAAGGICFSGVSVGGFHSGVDCVEAAEGAREGAGGDLTTAPAADAGLGGVALLSAGLTNVPGVVC